MKVAVVVSKQSRVEPFTVWELQIESTSAARDGYEGSVKLSTDLAIEAQIYLTNEYNDNIRPVYIDKRDQNQGCFM